MMQVASTFANAEKSEWYRQKRVTLSNWSRISTKVVKKKFKYIPELFLRFTHEDDTKIHWNIFKISRLRIFTVWADWDITLSKTIYKGLTQYINSITNTLQIFQINATGLINIMDCDYKVLNRIEKLRMYNNKLEPGKYINAWYKPKPKPFLRMLQKLWMPVDEIRFANLIYGNNEKVHIILDIHNNCLSRLKTYFPIINDMEQISWISLVIYTDIATFDADIDIQMVTYASNRWLNKKRCDFVFVDEESTGFSWLTNNNGQIYGHDVCMHHIMSFFK